MKYLIGAICAIIISLAFTGRKCEHVFTQIEQANVTIERQNLYGSITLPVYTWPTGLQEGKELICVKCFHVQKQVLDYGQPTTSTNVWPEGLRNTTFTCDTGISAIASRGNHVLISNGDTLYWSR